MLLLYQCHHFMLLGEPNVQLHGLSHAKIKKGAPLGITFISVKTMTKAL